MIDLVIDVSSLIWTCHLTIELAIDEWTCDQYLLWSYWVQSILRTYLYLIWTHDRKLVLWTRYLWLVLWLLIDQTIRTCFDQSEYSVIDVLAIWLTTSHLILYRYKLLLINDQHWSELANWNYIDLYNPWSIQQVWSIEQLDLVRLMTLQLDRLSDQTSLALSLYISSIDRASSTWSRSIDSTLV